MGVSAAVCLAAIMYAESRGEPFEGVVAIGQAAITKASNERVTLCKLAGVKRSEPDLAMRPYYRLLAHDLLKQPNASISRGADHWNVGTRPHLPGAVKRQIGRHVLYEINP